MERQKPVGQDLMGHVIENQSFSQEDQETLLQLQQMIEEPQTGSQAGFDFEDEEQMAEDSEVNQRKRGIWLSENKVLLGDKLLVSLVFSLFSRA